MAFEDVQDAILDMVEARGATDKFDVYEIDIPAGKKPRMENGAILPYVLISFGGKTPVALQNQRIDSSKNDLKWTSVAFECVANSGRDVRKLTKIIREMFEGYSPDPDWGELTERLSGDYTVLTPDYDLSPPRNATGIVFNTNVGAVTAG
jgi:hypothetical protein